MTLYIDPGTGSMLFTILFGLVGAAIYSLRMLLIKLRFGLSRGKVSVSSRRVPFVIFSDDKRYWTVFEPICREMDRRGQDVVYLTASPDDPALENTYPHIKAGCIGKGNAGFAKLNILNADIVLSTTPGLEVYQWKRSKGVRFYVHIPHAASDITLYRMFGIDYYDAILLSGQYQLDDVRALEHLRNLPEKELELIGIPYMDEMAARLERSGPTEAHSRTVLLAPSWGKSAIFHVYGGKIIDALLKTGCHIIVRPHPQSFTSEKELMEKLMQEYPESDRLEWNRDTDNFDVLRRSDILVSDFSGVVFDFALVYDKPIIYTKPEFDKSPYDVWWLDADPWTVSTLPKLGRELTPEAMENMGELIESCLTDPRYAKGRECAREETWVHRGEGALRAVDYLLSKQKELTSEEERR